MGTLKIGTGACGWCQADIQTPWQNRRKKNKNKIILPPCSSCNCIQILLLQCLLCFAQSLRQMVNVQENYVFYFKPGLLPLSRMLCFHQTFPRWSYNKPMMGLHCCCWGRSWWFPSHMRELYYYQVYVEVKNLMSILYIRKKYFPWPVSILFCKISILIIKKK